MRYHWKWTDAELNLVKNQQQHISEILEAMGGKVSKPETDPAKAIKQGGTVIHEVGGAIIGADAAYSVTNQWSQTWDVKNVFLADGAPFASTADKNPTLTIMARARSVRSVWLSVVLTSSGSSRMVRICWRGFSEP